MSITTGNSQIQQTYQQNRAANDAAVQQQQETTEANKQDAISAFDEAVSDLTTVQEDEVGQSTLETFAEDMTEVLSSGGQAILASLEDAASDALTEAEDFLYDAGSYVAEGVEEAANMASNIANGIGNVVSSVASFVGDAFEEGTNKGHEDEA